MKVELAVSRKQAYIPFNGAIRSSITWYVSLPTQHTCTMAGLGRSGLQGRDCSDMLPAAPIASSQQHGTGCAGGMLLGGMAGLAPECNNNLDRRNSKHYRKHGESQTLKAACSNRTSRSHFHICMDASDPARVRSCYQKHSESQE